MVVIQYRANSQLITINVGRPCEDKVLFEDSGLFLINGVPRWDTIYRVSDNGRPFMTRFFCLAESYYQDLYDVRIIVHALRQCHAWSLCDFHGGELKSKLRQAEIADEYPTTLDDMRTFLKRKSGVPTFLPRHQFPPNILTKTFYAQFGYHTQYPATATTAITQAHIPQTANTANLQMMLSHVLLSNIV